VSILLTCEAKTTGAPYNTAIAATVEDEPKGTFHELVVEQRARKTIEIKKRRKAAREEALAAIHKFRK